MKLSNPKEDIQNRTCSSEYDFSTYSVLYLKSPNASGSAPFQGSISNTHPGTQTEKNILRHNDTYRLLSQQDSDKEIGHKSLRLPDTKQTANTNNLGDRSPRAVQLQYENEYVSLLERKMMRNKQRQKLQQTPPYFANDQLKKERQ